MKKPFNFLLFSIFCIIISCRPKVSEETSITSESLTLVQGNIIPFKYHGHLYFPITIDHTVQGSFVFDTGGDVLYMDSLFYHHSSLARHNASDVSLSGIGNQIQQVKYIPRKYTCLCGSLTLHPSSAFVLSLRPIVGKHLDGILGVRVMEGSIFTIDYIREQMRILRRSELSTEGYERIPFSIRNHRIFLRATIQITSEKRIEGDFMLDTGKGEGIGLTSSCAQKNNLPQVLPEAIRTYTNWGGVGGSSSSYIAKAKAFYIGNQKIIAPVFSYFEDKQGIMASEEFIGLIGNEILDRFDLIVDMPDSCLYLRPNKNFALPFYTTFTGLSYVDRTDICDGWVIRALYENLTAEKAGMQIGDIILDINGRSTKDISFDEQKYFFKKINSPYMMTIKRGNRQFQVILQKEGRCF